MNQKITCIVCLAVVLLSACTDDEHGPAPFVVAEFADPMNETDIFQAENRVYVATRRGVSDEQVTDVYRVDLLSGEKTLLFSTDGGYSDEFIVSADEKFIAISVSPHDLSVENLPRLELFDLSTNTKTVVKTAANGFFIPFAFDPENKKVLYSRYGTSDPKAVRTLDLASGAEEIIYEGNASVVAINPVTSDILMSSFIIDWHGTVVGELINTGFEPQFFSPDGKEIIGSRGFVWDANRDFIEVVRYTIGTGEVESLTGTKTKGEFWAASMSPDQNFVLGLTNDSRDHFYDDLFVVNTVTLKRNKLMSTQSKEQAIGFFDSGRKVLFIVPSNEKVLYGIKVD